MTYKKYNTPKMKYNQQKAQAMYRNEEWAISYEDWILAWMDGSGSKWENRGRGKTQYSMFRIDPAKPWSADNVIIATRLEQRGESLRHPNRPPVTSRKPINYGIGHDLKKAEVIANDIWFESVSEAARYHDITRSDARYRIRSPHFTGWYYPDPK
jgi:hypothetical protein